MHNLLELTGIRLDACELVVGALLPPDLCDPIEQIRPVPATLSIFSGSLGAQIVRRCHDQCRQGDELECSLVHGVPVWAPKPGAVLRRGLPSARVPAHASEASAQLVEIRVPTRL